MDDSLMGRIMNWFTPERGLPVLPASARLPRVATDFRLYVFSIDRLSRGLLDPGSRQLSFERLRERLLPGLRLRLDPRDIEEVSADGSDIGLTALAGERWLAQSARSARDLEFAFLYSPFAIASGSRCLSAGWVVPSCSRSCVPHPRLQARIADGRVHLQLLPPRLCPGEDPALAMQSLLQRARE